MQRLALLFLIASVLGACDTPPPAPPVREPAPSVPSEAVVPAAAPASAPAAVIVAPPVPVLPAAQQQAQKLALATADLLESGNEEQARTELKRALGLDPQNKLAQNLTRQMAADPVTALGREFFAYTMRPSDTLSRIAGRFLGDVYAFYILARYNDIKVPKQVSSGQVIRIPGKAPPPGSVAANPPSPAEPAPRAPPPPSPARLPSVPAPAAASAATPQPPELTPGERAMRNAASAERAADLPRARIEYLKAASFNQPGAAAKAEQLRTQLSSRYSLNARSALARQDLDGAIVNWQRVLDLDPENPTARLELERARGLKDKLSKVK